jgi:hypothetical protein
MNVFLQIVIGIFIADFLIALFHWIDDSYLDYCISVPIISQIAKYNNMHHYFPRDILAYSYLEHLLVAGPLVCLVVGIPFILAPRMVIKYKYVAFTVLVVAGAGNIFHRWSHLRECELNAIGRSIYKTKLFVDHNHHVVHHAEDATKRYGMLFTFTNNFYDGIHMWRAFEYIIFALLGIKPNHKKPHLVFVEDVGKSSMHYKTEGSECPVVASKSDLDTMYTNLDMYFACPHQ